ncbi:hypothetical protein GCM10028819_25920 [Spirosoma humi]
MQTLLKTSCAYDQLTLAQLSSKDLLTKQTRNQQLGGVLLLLMVLMLGMAFVLQTYLIGVTTWALIPALAEYGKKRKAINQELQKRNLV